MMQTIAFEKGDLIMRQIGYVLILLIVIGLTGCSHLMKFALNTIPCGSEDSSYDVLEIDLEKQEIRLFWKYPDGRRFSTFENVRKWVEDQGEHLIAATNGGIYDPGHIPAGLYIEAESIRHPLNLREGYGNFYLKPNGVFLITGQGPKILESSLVKKIRTPVRYATQSGPLLVLNGEIHPAFTRGSKNRRLRSGIGVSEDQRVWIVISKCAISFYDFAMFFRDRLKCPNALYLDGSISKLWAPEIGRFDTVADKFAVIIGVIGRD